MLVPPYPPIFALDDACRIDQGVRVGRIEGQGEVGVIVVSEFSASFSCF